MREATRVVYHDMPPQVVDPAGKARTWITRGGNFAVSYSEVEPGAVLARAGNPEEYMVILPPDSATARIEAGEDTIEAGADSLTIVPPGVSRVTATSKGVVVRIFSRASTDVTALAGNSAVYADGAAELAPPELWPVPHDGYHLRHYRLADYADPNGDRMQPRLDPLGQGGRVARIEAELHRA